MAQVLYGYKLSKEASSNVFEWAETLRQIIKDYIDPKLKDYLFRHSVYKIDEYWFQFLEKKKPVHPHFKPQSILQEAWNQWLGAPSKEFLYDQEIKVTLFSYEKQYYAVLFCETPNLIREIEQSGLEKFSYWPMLAPPGDVSVEEWDERGRIWSAIFPDGRVNEKRGATFTLWDIRNLSTSNIIDFSEYPKLPFQQRALKYAILQHQYKHLNHPEQDICLHYESNRFISLALENIDLEWFNYTSYYLMEQFTRISDHASEKKF